MRRKHQYTYAGVAVYRGKVPIASVSADADDARAIEAFNDAKALPKTAVMVHYRCGFCGDERRYPDGSVPDALTACDGAAAYCPTSPVRAGFWEWVSGRYHCLAPAEEGS